MPVPDKKNCPMGHGMNVNGSCEPCKIKNCVRCYASVDTCGICLQPFLPNSNSSACVCPVGMALNGQGGCSQCQVSNCAECLTSEETTCITCHPPFRLTQDKKCKWPYSDLYACPVGEGIREGFCVKCMVPYCQRCKVNVDRCSVC